MDGTAAAGRQVAAGIALMLGSVVVFSSTHVLAKWLTGSFPVGELLVFRALGGLLMLLPFLRDPTHPGGLATVVVDRPWLQSMRLAASTVEVALLYLARSLMPLANVMTFWMSAPVIVAVLSALLLREGAPAGRWAAVLLGFGGAMLALWHEAQVTALGAALAATGALANGMVLTLTRALRRTPDAILVGSQMAGHAGARPGTGALGVAAAAGAGLGAAAGHGHDLPCAGGPRDAPRAGLGGRALQVSGAGAGGVLRLAVLRRRAAAGGGGGGRGDRGGGAVAVVVRTAGRPAMTGATLVADPAA